MTLNQQTHLCKRNYLFFSNSIWFLFWDLILPGRVEITSINLKISLPPLPTSYPGILRKCKTHTRCQSLFWRGIQRGHSFIVQEVVVLSVLWFGPDSLSSLVPLGGHGSVLGLVLHGVSLIACVPACGTPSLEWGSYAFFLAFTRLYPKPLSSLADYFCFSTCQIHCLYPWMPSQLPAWWRIKEGGTTGEGRTKIQYLKRTTLPLQLQTYYGS